MNQMLVDFELHLIRTPTEVCRILGMSYSSYAGYRHQDKALPDYLSLHIETLRRLPFETLHEIVRERLTNGRP